MGRGARGLREQPSDGECAVSREPERQGSRDGVRGASWVNESRDASPIRDAIHLRG